MARPSTSGRATTTAYSGSPTEYVPYDGLPSGNVGQHIPHRVPCLSKARKLIGYSAVHPLEEGLQETIAFGLEPGAA